MKNESSLQFYRHVFVVSLCGMMLMTCSRFAYANEAKKETLTKKTASSGVATKRNTESYWDSTSHNMIAKISGSNVSSAITFDDIEEAVEDYSYSAQNKKDPFIPPLISDLLAKEEIPIVSELQKYPTRSLRNVGSWTLYTGEKRSLIMSPLGANNAGVVVSTGSPIGNKGGVVKDIYDDRVVVREFDLRSDGTREFNDIVLWRKRDQKERTRQVIMSRGLGSARELGLSKRKLPKNNEKAEEIETDFSSELDLISDPASETMP